MNGFCTLRLHEKIAIESSPIARLIAVGCLIAGLSRAQTNPRQLAPILEETLQAPAVTAYQLRQYLMNRVPPLPSVADAGKWTAEAGRIRRHLLDDVVFHGWPPEWVNASPKFVSVEVLEGKGYRIRKLRYEIVPGFQSVALLYEPEHLDGRMPAILNVNGHERLRGKAVEYKQKRCINFARHGILALSLEWLACGELKHTENEHDFAAHLEAVGRTDELPAAKELAAKTWDFSTLASMLLEQGRLKLKKGIEPTQFSYHDSCHFKRTLHADQTPRNIMKQAGHELVEMDECDMCCGMGGSYTIKMPEISAPILQRKLQNIEKTGVPLLLTDCPGCTMQIGGGLDKRGSKIKVEHTAQRLAECIE